MPQEFSRTTARKTVLLPGGDTINIPVITKIAFIDPYERYQETEHQINNGLDANNQKADRRVHADPVHPVAVDQDGVPTEETPTADTAESLYVERIDDFKVLDPFERNQESQLNLDNTTGNDAVPPHFSNHVRTHIYRYHKDPQNPDDNGVWIDSELIDEFAVVDPFDQYQETRYNLVNPTNQEFRDGDVSGQASEDDPDITIPGDDEGEGTQANPVRLDPFQNIVNYSGGAYLLVQWIWHDWQYGSWPEMRVPVVPNTAGPYTTIPGVPSELHSTGLNNDIVWDEDNSTGDLIFESYLLDDTDGTFNETGGSGNLGATQPITIFGPCEVGITGPGTTLFPVGCPTPPPSGPLVHSFDDSDCVNIHSYQKTFLFRIAPTAAGSISPAKVQFILSNAIATEPYVVTHGTFNSTVQTTTAVDIGGFQFSAYVYSANDVDPYLLDEIFPLRKKGIDPADTGALGETLEIKHAHISCTSGHIDTGTNEIIPDLTNGTYEFRLESFTLPNDTEANTKRALMWPKLPVSQAWSGGFFPLYHYTVFIPPNTFINNPPPDIKFGVSPP